ncbi:MAG: bifunctional phosphoribosylaminoimidazolecarboxamide formyltransferase/IMP cyclohydrolase [Bacteroidales bacterium]|nr:bifunctional phosphoribosylaminoimidazolecarboxamide formyltransferase/IMP cyclohydrolase [Bacteroidales bacterium]
MIKIKTALISVYHKEGLEDLLFSLHNHDVQLISTGGTYEYINKLGYKAIKVEDISDFPAILGGRVKTLHPKIFGGILGRRDHLNDVNEMNKYGISAIDLVVVDLYPFESTLASGAFHQEIIEKIDIGGISLIRAAAKNFKDVVIIPSSSYYKTFTEIYNRKNGCTENADRYFFAGAAFNVSSHYDTAIFNYFNKENTHQSLKLSFCTGKALRYGENPHQKGFFWGNSDEIFTQLHGKEISYNNLLDLDAALNLIKEFSEPTFAILKHNNACGLASRENLSHAYTDALAGDPVSAYGGVLVTNRVLDETTALKINDLFFEIIAAPVYEKKSLEILKQKKNRVILQVHTAVYSKQIVKSALNGLLVQDADHKTECVHDFRNVTDKAPDAKQMEDLVFANIAVKHTKSNAIVLVKNKQLIASGTGQTSRVDALKQAILKAKENGFDLYGAVMASDAFFPFPDCVEIAHKEGINAVVQPGGSINDKATITYCNENNIAMVVTGNRHFKH